MKVTGPKRPQSVGVRIREGDKNVLELETTAVPLNECHQTAHLMMVSFMLYEFYLHRKRRAQGAGLGVERPLQSAVKNNASCPTQHPTQVYTRVLPSNKHVPAPPVRPARVSERKGSVLSSRPGDASPKRTKSSREAPLPPGAAAFPASVPGPVLPTLRTGGTPAEQTASRWPRTPHTHTFPSARNFWAAHGN